MKRAVVRVWAYATAAGVPRRSLSVAVIAGSILNPINQGEAVFGGSQVNLPQLVLTYSVPYCVSTHGPVSYHLSPDTASTTPAER
jgi:hypothetical protein